MNVMNELYRYEGVRLDEGMHLVCLSLDVNGEGFDSNVPSYFEIPFSNMPTTEDVENAKEQATSIIALIGEETVKAEGLSTDRMYSNGQLVREDAFTGGEPMVSLSEAHRDPYFGVVTSRYIFEKPSDEVLDAWNVSDRENLNDWYSIKSMDNVETFIKLTATVKEWPNQPSVPGRILGFSSLHDKQGNQSDERDVFVYCNALVMQKWCDKQGLEYPVPSGDPKQPWCYGVIWKASTGEVIGVKGYVKRNEGNV